MYYSQYNYPMKQSGIYSHNKKASVNSSTAASNTPAFLKNISPAETIYLSSRELGSNPLDILSNKHSVESNMKRLRPGDKPLPGFSRGESVKLDIFSKNDPRSDGMCDYISQRSEDSSQNSDDGESLRSSNIKIKKSSPTQIFIEVPKIVKYDAKNGEYKQFTKNGKTSGVTIIKDGKIIKLFTDTDDDDDKNRYQCNIINTNGQTQNFGPENGILTDGPVVNVNRRVKHNDCSENCGIF